MPGAACSAMDGDGAKRFLFSAPPPQGARYTRIGAMPTWAKGIDLGRPDRMFGAAAGFVDFYDPGGY